MNGPNTLYNLPEVVIIERKISDIEKFEAAFKQLIERQQALRTSFEEHNGEPVQFIHANLDFKVEYISGGESADSLNIETMVQAFIRPFDLKLAPLLRVRLVEITKEKHMLFFDMHLVSDGLSLQILIQEFTRLYAGNNLSQLQVNYTDFSEWQNEFLASDELIKQENYWLDRLKGEIVEVQLPYDFKRREHPRRLKGQA